MAERSLFDPTPDPACTLCDGYGYWVAYRHGLDPKNYPTFACSCLKAVV